MEKVLFISNSDDKYGSSKSLMALISKISTQKRIEPILVTPVFNNLNMECNKRNIKNYVIKYQNIVHRDNDSKIVTFFRRIIYSITNRIAKRKIVDICLKEKVSLVYTNTSVIGIGKNVADSIGVPHIQHLREFLDKDFNLTFFNKNYVKKNSKNNKYVAISKVISQSWVDKGIDERNIEVIYNGVATGTFNFIKPVNDKLKVAFVGSITPNKGQLEFLEAITILKKTYREKIEVDIWGTGEEGFVKELKDFCNNNNIDNTVQFKGYSNSIAENLVDYDIGIVASKSEGFGRVTVEYMMNGVCVIASDAGANIELIRDGINGLLYEQGNPNDLALVIQNVVDNSDLITEIRERAYKNALKKYSIDVNTKKITKKIIREIEIKRGKNEE